MWMKRGETLDELKSLLRKIQDLADTERMDPETVGEIIELLRLIKDRAQALHLMSVFDSATGRKNAGHPRIPERM
jgi:hypothetical protein